MLAVYWCARRNADQRLRLGLGHAEVGHQHSLLDALGIPDPVRQVLVGVLEGAGGDVGPGADVGQVGPDHALGRITAYERVAGHAPLGVNSFSPCGVLVPLRRLGGCGLLDRGSLAGRMNPAIGAGSGRRRFGFSVCMWATQASNSAGVWARIR